MECFYGFAKNMPKLLHVLNKRTRSTQQEANKKIPNIQVKYSLFAQFLIYSPTFPKYEQAKMILHIGKKANNRHSLCV